MKTFLLRNFILLIGLLTVLSACDKELAEIDENKVLKKISVQEQELINATNNLSLNILRAEFSENEDKNILFSPISVGMALGMIYNGVGEVEKSEIQNVLGLELLMEKELNKSYNELLNFFHVSNDQINISYANSMWFSQDIDINESYRTKVMAYYDAEITELNFNKPSAVDYINSWGNMTTNGSFEELVKIAPHSSKDIFLINAFGLNTNWKQVNYLFKATNQFNLYSGETQEVNTLNWDGVDVRLNENEDYSYLEIPFENDFIMLTVIQPEQAGSMTDFMTDFTLDDLDYLNISSDEFKANISLPEINFNSDKSLKSTFSKIGLNDLFLSTTNLSPSFDAGDRQLTDVSHLSKIETNTNHVNVKNSTSFSNINLKSVIVDKPFIYFIREKYTNTVLFAGFYTIPQDLD